MDVFGSDHAYTHLVIKNDGSVDPDDSFSRIPYEKGFSLLWYLQSLLGIEKFEGFLKGMVIYIFIIIIILISLVNICNSVGMNQSRSI